MFHPGVISGGRAKSGVNQSAELGDLFERHRINADPETDRPSDHRRDDDQESFS
jgi:hypothetical protein